LHTIIIVVLLLASSADKLRKALRGGASETESEHSRGDRNSAEVKAVPLVKTPEKGILKKYPRSSEDTRRLSKPSPQAKGTVDDWGSATKTVVRLETNREVEVAADSLGGGDGLRGEGTMAVRDDVLIEDDDDDSSSSSCSCEDESVDELNEVIVGNNGAARGNGEIPEPTGRVVSKRYHLTDLNSPSFSSLDDDKPTSSANVDMSSFTKDLEYFLSKPFSLNKTGEKKQLVEQNEKDSLSSKSDVDQPCEDRRSGGVRTVREDPSVGSYSPSGFGQKLAPVEPPDVGDRDRGALLFSLPPVTCSRDTELPSVGSIQSVSSSEAHAGGTSHPNSVKLSRKHFFDAAPPTSSNSSSVGTVGASPSHSPSPLHPPVVSASYSPRPVQRITPVPQPCPVEPKSPRALQHHPFSIESPHKSSPEQSTGLVSIGEKPGLISSSRSPTCPRSPSAQPRRMPVISSALPFSQTEQSRHPRHTDSVTNTADFSLNNAVGGVVPYRGGASGVRTSPKFSRSTKSPGTSGASERFISRSTLSLLPHTNPPPGDSITHVAPADIDAIIIREVPNSKPPELRFVPDSRGAYTKAPGSPGSPDDIDV